MTPTHLAIPTDASTDEVFVAAVATVALDAVPIPAVTPALALPVATDATDATTAA
jgi:hypothetical protein